jgi:hypothetical protein
VRFVPDENWVRNGIKDGAGIAPSITLPDWTIEKWETKPGTYALTPGLQFSSYAFEFIASRNVQHYILKVILPLVLIVMMSWSVFWTEPTNSSAQFSIAVTSMLTLIAYRFAGYSVAAVALHDAARCFLSNQHPACFLFANRSFDHDNPR